MTRIVKKPEVRKNEILDAARKFFFQKGYEQTTIQDIIEELSIAKGTFYYYFRSKIDLLDELIERITSEMRASIEPILNTDINAIEKFNAIFRAGAVFKMENIDVFLVFLKVLFKDENAIIRDKMYRRMIEKNASLFTPIIKQGIQEGLFNTSYPDDAGEMLVQIGRNLNEEICRLMLEEDVTPEYLIEILEKKMKFYQYSIERILGAQEGSLQVLIPDSEKIVRGFLMKMEKSNNKHKGKTNR